MLLLLNDLFYDDEKFKTIKSIMNILIDLVIRDKEKRSTLLFLFYYNQYSLILYILKRTTREPTMHMSILVWARKSGSILIFFLHDYALFWNDKVCRD
jgi:hypothetical protein